MDLRSSTILFQTFSPHHLITTSPVSDFILSVVTCVLPDCGRELSELLQIMTERNLNTYLNETTTEQTAPKKETKRVNDREKRKENELNNCLFSNANFFISLIERAFKLMKNGFYLHTYISN